MCSTDKFAEHPGKRGKIKIKHDRQVINIVTLNPSAGSVPQILFMLTSFVVPRKLCFKNIIKTKTLSPWKYIFPQVLKPGNRPVAERLLVWVARILASRAKFTSETLPGGVLERYLLEICGTCYDMLMVNKFVFKVLDYIRCWDRQTVAYAVGWRCAAMQSTATSCDYVNMFSLQRKTAGQMLLLAQLIKLLAGCCYNADVCLCRGVQLQKLCNCCLIAVASVSKSQLPYTSCLIHLLKE